MTITITTPKCMICGRTATLEVNASGYLDWKCGMLIQKALPQLTAGQRELLITGTHEECFKRMCGETR